jgi:hypothetical protein
MLGADQPKVFAQDFQQGVMWLHSQLVPLAIDM